MKRVYTDSGATIKGDLRLLLWRVWDVSKPLLVLVMLNPSKADGKKDDPTVRKAVGFADLLGYGGVFIVNVSAYRATKPADLFAYLRRIGYDAKSDRLPEPANEEVLRVMFNGSYAVCLAWGAHGRRLPGACKRITTFLGAPADRRGAVLARLADGTPAHPLMLPYSCIAGSRLHANLTRAAP